MNKTLAIHIESDYLIAAIEPLTGKFHEITKRGKARFPFYFYVDKLNNRIDYSELYKKNALDAAPDYYGNFTGQLGKKTFLLNAYENEFVELLFPLISDVKEMYYTIISTLVSDEPDKNEPIPLSLSYSNYISDESKAVLEDFFRRNNFEIENSTRDFPLLVSKAFFRKNSIDFNKKKVAFIEALGKDLNISVVNSYNRFDSEITHKQTFDNFGLDPRSFILAKKIVDDLNKQEGVLNTTESKEQEYLRHLPLAEKLLENSENTVSPYLQVETNFAVDKNRTRTINISLEELNQLTYAHVRQIARYFESHFLSENGLNVNEFDKIILLGDMLCNSSVQNEFIRFGRNKVEFLDSHEIFMVLRSLLHTEAPQKQEEKPEEEFKEVDFLNVQSLVSGQTVILKNFDSAPGKGESVQKLNYMGERKFLVEMSTRSLQRGDIAEALAEVWVPGMQVDFKITFNGKLRGVFKTRKIVNIHVSV